jgi:hypothetical protein
MGAAELTQTTGNASGARRARVHTRPIAVAYAGMWVLTCLGAVIGSAVPGLAPGGQPHPTLHGTPSDFASIAIVNARVLSAPFLLALFHFPAGRRSRNLGDLLVVALLGGNALRVGLALGRARGALIPYLPQLPVEWLAAALAAATWLTLRTGARDRTGLAYLAAVLALVAAAAAIETICTPHSANGEHTLRVEVEESIGALRSPGPISVRKARGGLPAPDRAPAPALPSRSLRSLPLAVARFRSAAWPALPDYVNHPPDPAKEGPGMNAVCVIWNCLQIAHSGGLGCSALSADSDRCGC